jgi:hypothetical protein
MSKNVQNWITDIAPSITRNHGYRTVVTQNHGYRTVDHGRGFFGHFTTSYISQFRAVSGWHWHNGPQNGHQNAPFRAGTGTMDPKMDPKMHHFGLARVGGKRVARLGCEMGPEWAMSNVHSSTFHLPTNAFVTALHTRRCRHTIERHTCSNVWLLDVTWHEDCMAQLHSRDLAYWSCEPQHDQISARAIRVAADISAITIPTTSSLQLRVSRKREGHAWFLYTRPSDMNVIRTADPVQFRLTEWQDKAIHCCFSTYGDIPEQG